MIRLPAALTWLVSEASEVGMMMLPLFASRQYL
jgi:hypothetical protein